MIRINELQTTKVGPKLWRLERALKFVHNDKTYMVPSGFLTDGASTPRVLWSLCPPMAGLTAEPAVLHDYLYSRSSRYNVSRAEADWYFLLAMRSAGVSLARRQTVYEGVRIGGFASWQKMYYHKKANVDTCYLRKE